MLKRLSVFLLVMLWTVFVQAAVRDASGGSSQMVAKIQGMMRQVTKERDTLKTENAKLQAELDKLAKQNAELKSDGEKISRKLAGQQSSNNKLQVRQEQIFSKLEEVVEKYKILKQQKNQLHTEMTGLQVEYQNTSEQLQLCAAHNGKLISSANELLERYQNKGTFDGLMQTEGVLQFKSVEMEAIVQEYEDKIRAEEYKDVVSLNHSTK